MIYLYFFLYKLNMNYKNKYIKYKLKYLNFKQSGGNIEEFIKLKGFIYE